MMGIPTKSCGFTDVRPVNGSPGKYVCTVCRKVMRDSYRHELPGAMCREVDQRDPVDVDKEAP